MSTLTDTTATPRPGDSYDYFRLHVKNHSERPTVMIPVAQIREWREIEAVNEAIRKAGC